MTNAPSGWTQTGRRASEGDAHSASTITPPLVGGASGTGEVQEGRQESLQPYEPSQSYAHHQQQYHYPYGNTAAGEGTQSGQGQRTGLLTVDEVGIAGSAPIPPSMTRARSSNEISIKPKPKAVDADGSGVTTTVDGAVGTGDEAGKPDDWMEGRLRSLAARAEGLIPSASFPVALEKARSRRERELDGRKGEPGHEDGSVDEDGDEDGMARIPHSSQSFPMLHTGQTASSAASNPDQGPEYRAQLPMVLPDYLLPAQAGSDRASNRPDLMDLGAYQTMHQQQHDYVNNGGSGGNPYNAVPHGTYSGVTPPSSSHSPVSMMYPGMQPHHGDPNLDYTALAAGLGSNPGVVNTNDPALYRPSSVSASSAHSPYEVLNNPYLTTSHTPPLPAMYGQQAYYNPYSSAGHPPPSHDPRGTYFGSPVNSPPVSPAMGMKPWLPPLDDDPSVPGPQANNGGMSSPTMSSLSTSMVTAQPPNTVGGWSNGWAGQPVGPGAVTAGGGQTGFYGVPSWDHGSRGGGAGTGSRGNRGGRADASEHGPSGGGADGRSGQTRNGSRGGAGYRPSQPSHPNSFGSAVQNMPIDGYIGNGYPSMSQGGSFAGSTGYMPYQTGYYGGVPSYLNYAQLAEATRPMLPSPVASQYGNNRGGRGGRQSRRGRWSVGGNNNEGPLHQARGPRPTSPEGRQGHRANARSMSSINDVLEQMVLGSPSATKHDLPQRPAPGSPDQEDRRAAGRKHYHPAAPANRSEWVMWVGNVPNNATHEEMWKFLNQPIPREAVPQSIPYKEHIKISSIFLISRSSCAFVNLETQDELLLAISYFNHRLLRPLDPRCPKLVCRVRKMDDDLKAGVGGQRGAGLHTKYVQDLLAQQKAEVASEEKTPSDVTKMPELETPLSPAAMEYPPDMVTPAAFAAWHRERSQSGTHSFASTNSSFLGRHFPKRYFILKSLTQEELETSIKTGKWKTQLHNEAILDQAFRTSPEVYLIFGANKQGNFYGWAIMRSGIGSLARNARSISCGSRSQLPTTPSSERVNSGGTAERSSGSTSRSTDDPATTRSGRPRIPHASSDTFRMTTQSPGELSPSEEVNYSAMRLPDVANQAKPPIRLASVPESESRSNTLDAEALARIRAGQDSGFKLDDRAPSRAAERRSNSTGSQGSNPDQAESNKPDASDDKPDGDGIIRHDMADPVSSDVAHVVDASGPGPAENQSAKIGTVFDVEWVKTGVLPFHRLRHLRNPWNQDKEVKVSRDGTELEPTVGALLLAEWDKLESSAPTS